MKGYALYVDGHWVEHGSSVLDVHNPATGDVVGSVPTTSRAMVRNAIDAAYRALAFWSGIAAGQRAELLTRVATRIRNDVDQLAHVLTMEQGKPLAEARGEMNISFSRPISNGMRRRRSVFRGKLFLPAFPINAFWRFASTYSVNPALNQ